MALVMTTMPFGRPVYRFYIEITDSSFNIFMKYLYNSEIPHIFSLNNITFYSILDGKFGIGIQNLHVNPLLKKYQRIFIFP